MARKKVNNVPVILFILLIIVGPWTIKREQNDMESVVRKATRKVGGRRVVVLTAVTGHYKDFVENLRCWMKTGAKTELVVVALDDDMKNYAKEQGFLVIDRAKEEEKGNREFGGDGFNRVTKRKLEVIADVLNLGLDVVFTDVDMVWCGDVVKDLVKRGKQGGQLVLVQNDNGKEGQRVVRFNSGFYYARSGRHVQHLFREMVEYGNRSHNRRHNDQVVFNQMACKPVGGGKQLSVDQHGKGQNIIVCEWRQVVHIQTLPLTVYTNGASWTQPNNRSQLATRCINRDIRVFHNNWSRGQEEKLNRMYQAQLWLWDNNHRRCRVPLVPSISDPSNKLSDMSPS